MTKMKICGLRRSQDVEAVNRVHADYAGFVLAKQSRRAVDRTMLEQLKPLLAPGILAVGVFVDAPPAQVAELLQAGLIDMAQLHGTEDGEYLKELRGMVDRPMIQAFQIKTREDVRRARESTAEMILLDSGAGTGSTFDWSLLEEVGRPYFLAGGLSPENVQQAIACCHPAVVDVSSGVETEGVKDAKKIAAFAAAIHGTQTAEIPYR